MAPWGVLFVVLAALCNCAVSTVAPGTYTIVNTAFPLSVRHCQFELYGCGSGAVGPADDFHFKVIPALNGDAECISFQSVNFPTKYIAPIDTEEPGRLGIVDAPAAADASFAVVAGLANASALSFRSQAAGALNGAYLALDGTLRGKCAGFYSPPASDLALVAAPAKGNATWELVQPPPPPPVLVTVNSDNVTHDVNPFFLGCHSDSGFVHQARGFYSQMVFGNSFEASLPEGPAWVTVTPKGGSGTAAIDTSRPFHGNASMRLEYTSPGDGVFGVANRGLGSEGLFIEGGKSYEGYMFVTSKTAVQLTVALRDFSNNNATLVSTTVAFAGGDWTRVNFTLTPTTGTTCVDGSNDKRVNCGHMGSEPGHICVQCGGELVVGLSSPGTVNVDFVFLQPGEWGRFAGLSVLRSGVETLQQMGIRLIRLGGSFTITDYYTWTNWIGPAWERPTMQAEWKNELISGWGPFEFIDMCTAAGIEPVVTLSADSGTCCSPETMADLVEYCYGTQNTEWGAKRIANGHPEIYPLRFVELGNEQYNANYADQVAAMETRASKLGMPDTLFYMNPNNGNWLNPTDAAKVEKLNISDHAVMDEHVGAGGAVERAEAMFKANPNLTMGMVNAETNAGTHHMTRAVQEGADLNDWFNCGADWCSRLHFRTASFCTERSGHYDAFDQGISFFLPNMTWLQPPGYVHQMINQTWQPHGVDVQVNDTTDASASAQISSDGRFLVVRLTNSGNDVAKVQLDVGPAGAFKANATVLEIFSESGDAANMPGNPTAIAPSTRTIDLVKRDKIIELKPNSYTVVTLQRD